MAGRSGTGMVIDSIGGQIGYEVLVSLPGGCSEAVGCDGW